MEKEVVIFEDGVSDTLYFNLGICILNGNTSPFHVRAPKTYSGPLIEVKTHAVNIIIEKPNLWERVKLSWWVFKQLKDYFNDENINSR
jgi:hypothetical protein